MKNVIVNIFFTTIGVAIAYGMIALTEPDEEPAPYQPPSEFAETLFDSTVDHEVEELTSRDAEDRYIIDENSLTIEITEEGFTLRTANSFLEFAADENLFKTKVDVEMTSYSLYFNNHLFEAETSTPSSDVYEVEMSMEDLVTKLTTLKPEDVDWLAQEIR